MWPHFLMMLSIWNISQKLISGKNVFLSTQDLNLLTKTILYSIKEQFITLYFQLLIVPFFLNLRYQNSFYGVDLSNLRESALEEYFRQPIVVSCTNFSSKE